VNGDDFVCHVGAFWRAGKVRCWHSNRGIGLVLGDFG
jgi:hypothetical protein